MPETNKEIALVMILAMKRIVAPYCLICIVWVANLISSAGR